MILLILLLIKLVCANQSTTIVSIRQSKTDCSLTPLAEEGPFFVDDVPKRSDIREKRIGLPLFLKLYVKDGETCNPVTNASVYIWHCDAVGTYSGFRMRSVGERMAEGRLQIQNYNQFLRGYQITDEQGSVYFATIVPGWYYGRTLHIHFEVIVDKKVVHVGQFFVGRSIIKFIETLPLYRNSRAKGVDNKLDRVYNSINGEKSILEAKGDSKGFNASFDIVVDLNLSIPVGLGPGPHYGYNPGDYPAQLASCFCNRHHRWEVPIPKKDDSYIGGPEM